MAKKNNIKEQETTVEVPVVETPEIVEEIKAEETPVETPVVEEVPVAKETQKTVEKSGIEPAAVKVPETKPVKHSRILRYWNGMAY